MYDGEGWKHKKKNGLYWCYLLPANRTSQKDEVPNIRDGLQEIDIAILDVLDNWPNLLDKLKIFIEQFGTHYAQKSTMAIGANFETRYTAKETLENTEQIRNKCSSEAGGISIFGYGYQESSANCQGSDQRRLTGPWVPGTIVPNEY